jgi:hypothetical protein
MILALSSCDNRFEYVLPVNEPRMVVNFVSADSQPWTGTLTLSKPILEPADFEGVPGTTLKISEDGNLIETVSDILYDPRKGDQLKTVSKPIPGKTYTIEAISSNYGTAAGTYQQPLPVPIEKFDISLIGPDPKFDNAEAIEFDVTFVDPPGETFYRIGIIAAWDSVHFNGGYYQLRFSDPAYEGSGEIIDNGLLLFDDNLFDGQRVTMTLKARASFESKTLRPEDRYDYHWVILRSVSKSFYRYLITQDLQWSNYFDPYAQPTKVETNIKNGFGVVGGYTMTVKGKPYMY